MGPASTATGPQQRRRLLTARCGVSALAAAVVLVAGCASPPDRSAAGSTPRSSSLGTTAGCSAADAGQLVQRFIDSFDSGDMGQLDQIFAGPELFQWYSTDPPGRRIDEEARDRNGLGAYFTQRHEQHERLALQSFRFNGTAGGVGNFEFELVRRADDGLAPTPYVGKGALDCTTSLPVLVVWSMARRPRSPIRTR